MGTVCDSKNDQSNPNNESDIGGKYRVSELPQKFKKIIFEDKIQDFLDKKYINEDPVFQLIRNEEKKILFQFYQSKKNNFLINMNSYFDKRNLNFIPELTKPIISIEHGREILEKKIKREIIEINDNENADKIDYLTIMILGQNGTGKSTLVNALLKLEGRERAKVRDESKDYGLPCTMEETRVYKSKRVPYFSLIDTRGIELSKYDIETVGLKAGKFIEDQIKQNKIMDFVHCIFYCVSSTKFTEVEKELVNQLASIIGPSQIPLIIVITNTADEKQIKYMKKHIKNQNFDNVIDVLAERKKIINETYVEPYGLDDLINLTLKRCKNAINGHMKKYMINDLTIYIKNKIFGANESTKEFIVNKMMLETIENDRKNEGFRNFDEYIISIYDKNIFNFLNKYKMESESKNLIRKSEFNQHKINFVSYNQNYINQIISNNELSLFANKFLDIQATKEKESMKAVEMTNKRNFNDFVDTSRKFLFDNFNYFSLKYYIHFVVTKISIKLSDSFVKELNAIVENLMYKDEIQEQIKQVFMKKFNDFEKRVKSNLSYPKNNDFNYNIRFEERDDIQEMSDYTKINKNENDSEMNTPLVFNK